MAKRGVSALPTARVARRGWRIAKAARLAAYGFVIFCGVGVLAARSVYGDAKITALTIGHELAEWEMSEAAGPFA